METNIKEERNGGQSNSRQRETTINEGTGPRVPNKEK